MAGRDLTELLNGAVGGDDAAADELLLAIYDQLRSMARGHVANESPTVEPTALVHEAWMRLGRTGAEWRHRGHFFAAAAQAMRRILVEHARRRSAAKRGGGARQVGVESLAIEMPDPAWILDLDQALSDLAVDYPREAQVVALRYFGGLAVAEVAAALDVSVGTVERDWRLARARLSQRLQLGEDP